MKKMRHVDHLLLDYLEKELSTTMREQVNAHLRVCPDCAEQLDTLRQTFFLLEQEALPEPDNVAWATFLPNVRQKIEASQVRWWEGWLPKLLPALATALIMALMFSLSNQWRPAITAEKDTWLLTESMDADSDIYSAIAEADSSDAVFAQLMEDDDDTFVEAVKADLTDEDSEKATVIDEAMYDDLIRSEQIFNDADTALESMSPDELEKFIKQLQAISFKIG